MNVSVVDVKEGDGLLKSLENAVHITYSVEFFDTQKLIYNFDSAFLKIADDGGEVICLLPVNINSNKIFSVYKDYTKIIWFKKRVINFKNVVSGLLSKGFEYIEIQLQCDDDSLQDISGLRKTGLVSSVLKIDEKIKSEGDLLYVFNKKARNEVRKSQQFNYIVKFLDVTFFPDMYDFYTENMRRHGTPAKSRERLEKMFSGFKNKIKFLSVYDGDKIIGLNIFLVEGNYLKLVYNFSKKEYWTKCINNFLYFKTLLYGIDNGITVFDFGPSIETDYSHNKFKIGFGAKTYPIMKIVGGSFKYRVVSWFKQKIYNLKLRLNKIFGV